jgi:EmrB/QacA subfamily drug resistance transporter
MTPTRARWVLFLAALGSFMVALDALVVATSLEPIRHELGASVVQLEWTVNAYSLSFAVLLMTGSALGDRFGRRRVLAVGFGVFAVASAACALAPSAGALIAARVIQGAGAALVMPTGLALIAAAFPPERRGAALGLYGAVTGLAVAAGPVIGGAIAQGIEWEWIFWLNVPVALAAIPLVYRRLDESYGPPRRLDLPGLGLVTAGALGVVWGLVRGNPAGWGSAEVVGALAGGAALLAGFVAWERRAPEPMLPLGLFRARAFSAGNAAVFLMTASLMGSLFFLAQLVQVSLGAGPLGGGLRLLPWTATLFFVAPVAGAFVDRVGARALVAGGTALQAAGMGWVALVIADGPTFPELIAPFVLAGIGISMALPAIQAVVLSAVKPEAVGTASGVNSTMRQLGGVFGVAVMVAVFSSTGSYASPDAFADGAAPAIAASAALALAGVMAGAALPRRRRRQAQGGPLAPVMEPSA